MVSEILLLYRCVYRCGSLVFSISSRLPPFLSSHPRGNAAIPLLLYFRSDRNLRHYFLFLSVFQRFRKNVPRNMRPLVEAEDDKATTPESLRCETRADTALPPQEQMQQHKRL